MKSVVPHLDIGDIFRGAMSYLLIEIGMLILMVTVPGLATFLPELIG